MADMLEVIIISDEVGARKPGRRIFDLACDALGLSAQECLFVGDSYDADVTGAAAAGLVPVWLTRQRPGEGVQAAVIERLEELPALLSEGGFVAGV
jgi:putative hydrolase of the HAD superfamily